jgi:uncharacterized membrane protein YbhN (UPF0104 family)
MYPALPAWLKHAGALLSLAGFGALGVLALLALQGRALGALHAALLRRLFDTALAERLRAAGATFVNGCVALLHARTGLVFFALTALLWALDLIMVQRVAVAFDLSIAWGNLLFVLLVIAVGTMVPSSPGFVGTYEFFGVAALGIIGVTGPRALSFIVVLHAVSLIVPSVLGSLCLISLGSTPARPPSEAPVETR